MGTTRSFSAMLNQYLPNELLKEEISKRDWWLSNVEKDDGWLDGDLVVPFQGATASSVQFGGLTASTDIGEYQYVRGVISGGPPEAWGSLLFNHRDLMEHGKVSEQNFLKILPGQIDDFMEYMKNIISLAITNGPAFATANVDGTNAGVLGVDRVERFTIGQKVRLYNATAGGTTAYVNAIDMNNSTVTLYNARSGGSALALLTLLYTVANGTKVYFDGTDPANPNSAANQFSNVRSALLSAANGGSASLYGQTKLSWPYLQAINISGSGITAVNILEQIFDAYTTVKNRGKGNPNKVIMSYKHLGSVMKALEAGKGMFHQDPKGTRVSVYGWTEIDIFGVQGQLTVVGIQEMNDDWIGLIDMRSFKFYSNGMFRKRVSPDGIEFFEIRATTGYSYVVDVALFGDLVCLRPSYSGILYGISY